MSIFGDLFAAGAVGMHATYHGETVLYRRAGESLNRSYTALVVRDPEEILREAGDITVPSLIVGIVANADKSLGLLANEVNTDYDTVRVALHIGETPSERQVVRVLSSHAGMTRILVQ